MSIFWEYKIQILPVLLAFIIFKIPSILHRLKKEYYVPIYFSIYPFSKLNSSLSNYLGENFFCDDMDEVTAENFRNNLIVKSTISLSISVLLIPVFVGFVDSFFLTIDTLWQFLIFLAVERFYHVVKSILKFHEYTFSTWKYKIILIITYTFYIGIVLTLIYKTYVWANKFVITNDYFGMMSDIWNLIFVEIGIKGIIVVILTTVFTIVFANRDIRKGNLARNEE